MLITEMNITVLAGITSITVWGSKGEAAEIDLVFPLSPEDFADDLRKLADAVLRAERA